MHTWNEEYHLLLFPLTRENEILTEQIKKIHTLIKTDEPREIMD